MKSPLVVMSAVTGKPTKEEIFEYMKSLNESGISQIMVYPRAGCELEYLTDEWFNAVDNFIDGAKKLDMDLWLYDEFNWPSGDAGGIVSDKYPLKAIETKGENKGEIRYRSPLENKKDRFFPDLLNEDATDLFIKSTHEKYYKRYGKYFGNIIKGIFSDEPALGYTCTKTSIPYYEGIEDDYKNRFNRDFNNDLNDEYENFTENAIDIISERFNKCFVKKIASWCKNHNLIMTGHLMEDNSPFGAVKQNGKLLKNLSAFMLPGIDEIETDFNDEREFCLLGTAMYCKNENGLMAELFAIGPCDMTYAKKKCMIYLMSSFGVNYYFLALSHMDKRGNLYKDIYFNDFSCDQPDFKGTKILSHDALCAKKLADKDFTPCVYVRYPAKICAKRVTNPTDIKRFYKLINEFSLSQIQWKFLDENEDRKNIPVIEFTDDFEYVLDGKICSGNEIIEKFINLYVTDEYGNVPDGIFVRTFDDGTTVVINLNDNPKTLKKDDKIFKIERYGVLVNDFFAPKMSEEKIDATFDVKYHSYNMIRTMYVNDQKVAKIYCEDDTDVIFAIRNGAEAYIENEKINCALNNNNLLFKGIENLYRTSDFITLKKGENIIKSGNDYKYLPSVFVLGDFKSDVNSGDICTVNLSKRKKEILCGEKISDYGKVEFNANIKIPKGAKAIKIKGTELYTLIYADDALLGEKICSPYVFNIGEDLQNKIVNLKIVQYSSLGPIFGDVKYYDEIKENVTWRGTPTPQKTLFGFDKISFLLRKRKSLF